MITFPRYRHNCNHCKFLGQFEDYDLYFCSQEINRQEYVTLKARYGWEPEDMHEGLYAPLDSIREARRRASELGYLSESPKEYCNLHGSYSANFSECPMCRRDAKTNLFLTDEDRQELQAMTSAVENPVSPELVAVWREELWKEFA